jgi:ATP-dependent Clp protease ATP-binding subunit ClpC
MMRGYNFSEGARRTLERAREEALEVRHGSMGTEHLLLGLLRSDEDIVTHVLQSMSVDAEETRHTVMDIVKKGMAVPTGHDLPYTSRGKKTLELAMAQAEEWGHSYVGTEQ